MRQLLLLIYLLLSIAVFAQTPLEKIRAERQKNEATIYQAFISFLKLPNVAADTINIRKNAGHLKDLMISKGISNVQLLEGEHSFVPPVVFGEWRVPGAKRTVVFYAHYDGQPVNATLWAKGLQPFQPHLLNARFDEGGQVQKEQFPIPENWRLYGRGTSDDKGGIIAILSAFTAIKESGLSFPFNLKFFFEGEEEQGSPHFAQILSAYKSIIQSDLWIICDGPVHQSGRKQVVFGARGDTHLTLTVYGPKSPLHSGHYGNWVPNPVMTLAQLLATMKTEKGKVAIKDFYLDVLPLNTMERKALNEIPEADSSLKKSIGFAMEEMPGTSLNEAINLPSLNINGIESSNVGTIQANVIPVSATAVLDLRLVKGNDWKKQQDKVIAHIKKQGFFVTENAPTEEERLTYNKIVEIKRGTGNNAQRTPMNLPVAKNIVAAVQKTTTGTILLIPTLGGSLPVDDIVNVLHTPFIVVPIANHDNNQHAENENIRIKNLWEGIDMMASIMLMNYE